MRDSGEKRGGFNVAGAVLGVLLLSYLFFPIAYAFPLRMAFGRTVFDKPLVGAFFGPIEYLSKHMEAYDELIEWQTDVTGYHNLR